MTKPIPFNGRRFDPLHRQFRVALQPILNGGDLCFVNCDANIVSYHFGRVVCICMYDSGRPCGDVHGMDSQLGQGGRSLKTLICMHIW